MQTTVHVWVRECSEPFRVFGVYLIHGLIGLEKVGIGLDALWQSGGFGVEEVLICPLLTDRALNLCEVISLVGLMSAEAWRACSYLLHDYNRATLGVRVD
jgi:hypothetical protein